MQSPQASIIERLEQEYRAALARGEFLIRQCRDCGRYSFPAAPSCPFCEAEDLKWVVPTGRAWIHALPVRLPGDAGQEPAPLVEVELEEGPRLLSRVMDVARDKLLVGMPVSPHVGMLDGQPAVLFYNKEQGSEEW